MAYGENSNPEHSKYQKMAAYLRISALNCSFMYQVALRQPFSISQPHFIPDSRITLTSDTTWMIMENIPEIDASSINNNKSKSHEKSCTKVIEKVVIPKYRSPSEEKVNSIWDILIYDIPAHWSKKEILNHLTAWEKPLTMSVKQQRKYQMTRPQSIQLKKKSGKNSSAQDSQKATGEKSSSSKRSSHNTKDLSKLAGLSKALNQSLNLNAKELAGIKHLLGLLKELI
ncbi:hypothetical protein GLOIN_2v1662849 [Rhizophagus clarus]|uniref:Uncharacterized protein n=1 Tax=Rhizophagus clarus TaxID=94130 RepID=A0A8H3MDG0_9GLOM|nr:hypothetical protein GLOIN_2v1662849 [Rhizophagus clarus]